MDHYPRASAFARRGNCAKLRMREIDKMLQSRAVTESAGPYYVEQVDTPQGPAWRLAGPGLDATRAYPWAEAREKLAELAEMMNFAWRQSEGRPQDDPPGDLDEGA